MKNKVKILFRISLLLLITFIIFIVIGVHSNYLVNHAITISMVLFPKVLIEKLLNLIKYLYFYMYCILCVQLVF